MISHEDQARKPYDGTRGSADRARKGWVAQAGSLKCPKMTPILNHQLGIGLNEGRT